MNVIDLRFNAGLVLLTAAACAAGPVRALGR